jgi:hypothetical protein
MPATIAWYLLTFLLADLKPMLSQANRIRQFALDHYIAPARAKGLTEITIRAGDVHRKMSLTNAMPAVCSAIGSHKFDEYAGVTRTALTGPANGANVYYTFSLNVRSLSERVTVRCQEPVLRPVQSQPRKSLDLGGAVVLISCVKSKLAHPAPARALYTSAWFRKVRDIVEASGARWFLLSSRYGLVAPADVVRFYALLYQQSSASLDRENWPRLIDIAIGPIVACTYFLNHLRFAEKAETGHGSSALAHMH